MTEHTRDLYESLSGADDVDTGEARNGLRHMVSLSMTKIADGLIDPKLVLSWLAGALGVPAAITGVFVPIREAGALLPQMLMAGRLQRMAQRKWFWVAGSVVQGLMAAAIVLSALTLEGQALGIAMVLALAVFSVGRAACSVSYKDIQGKTVAKTRRGAVTGVAGSASSLAVLGFAVLLIFGIGQDVGPVVVAIALASGLWMAAAAVFSSLNEPDSEDRDAPVFDWSPLRDDPQFRRFIATRGALTVTALAPPYFVLLAPGESALQGLGALVLASSAASFLSSYVWGRFADRSSRWVLVLSGVVAAVFMGLAVTAATFGLAEPVWVIPALLFGLMIAYHGVRQGRSTYLVDMAPEEARSSYAALANTLIGTLDIVGSGYQTFINNDFGNTDAIKLNGNQVLRGSGAAPAGRWADFYIEAKNANGSKINRLQLGDATGGTKFGLAYPPLQTYLTNYPSDTGTISLVVQFSLTGNGRMIAVGDWEFQMRSTGRVWYKNIAGNFSTNRIVGPGLGVTQHYLITWNGPDLYACEGDTYSGNLSADYTAGGDGINGAFNLFGATSGNPEAATPVVIADGATVYHLYVTDQFYGPGTDLSPIWDQANQQSAITGPGSVLAGDTPVYSMAGGPGKFASENYGSYGKVPCYPNWSASVAQIR